MTSDFNKTTIQRTFTSPNSAFRTLFKDKPVDEFDGNSFIHYYDLQLITENRNLGIDIYRFEVNNYPGFSNAMLYERGLFLYRDDGSASESVRARWRNSVHDWPKLETVDNLQIKENKLTANIKFSDDSIKSANLGFAKSPEAYFVFRTNDSYDTFIDSLRHHIQDEDIAFKLMIFNKGSDIVENDDIRSIPDDALIFTDRAALDACPSLKHKSVKRLDEMINSYYGSYHSFGAKFKKVTAAKNLKYEFNSPDSIIVYTPSLADHAAADSSINDGDVSAYSKLLKTSLKEIYNISENGILFTNNPEKVIETTSFDLAIIDRHALKDFKEDEIPYCGIKLPLYENFNEQQQSSSDGLYTDLAKDIVKIVVDKYKQ